MSEDRAILRVQYTPVKPAGGLRRALQGFLKYVHYRDHHAPESADKTDVRGLLDYIAYRDAASPKARLFDASGTVGDTERKALADFIEQSVADVRRRGGPRNSTENHACYRMIISPENSRGLDLRALTKAAVDQLARDAGSGGLPPWIAAEHRNTNHPHVHLIVAGRREVSPGRFRTMLITDPRLDRMKDALAHEMARQREVGARLRATALRPGEARSEPVLHAGPSPEHVGSNTSPAELSRVDFDVVGHRFADPRRPALTQRPRTSARAYGDTPVGSLLQASAALKVARMAGRAARHYQREAEVAGQERGA